LPVRIAGWLSGLRHYPPPPGGGIRLDLNEAPWGPPERVVEAVARAAREANRYPRREEVERLYELLSDYVGVDPRMLVVGLGGDMVLEKAFHLVAEPGGSVVAPSPSFSMYPVYASAYGMRLSGPRLQLRGEEWGLDVGELLEAMRRWEPRLVAVDNPNNPTGSLLLGEAELSELLEEACRRGTLVVLDEAYYEFSGVTHVGLTEAYDCLLVVRTLSKAFGLAGLRVGYGVAAPGLAEKLRALMPPFLPRTSIAAATAALEDPGYAEERVRLLRREREWLRSRLRGLGAAAYQSWTNFILVRVPWLEDPVAALAERGILVRRVPLEGGGWMRVTVGAPRENSLLVSALAATLEAVEPRDNPVPGDDHGVGEGDAEEPG
jgi:histidinol-phosphate aminotransferase